MRLDTLCYSYDMDTNTERTMRFMEEMGPIVGDRTDPALEALAPPLRAALVEMPMVGLMVKHPWCNSTPVMVGQCNKMLTAKLGMARDYLGQTPPNIEMYLHVVVERPWRMETLERFYNRDKVDAAGLAAILPGIWTDTEMPTLNLADPFYLWAEAGFATDDPEGWMALPDALRVYRGGEIGGISWTLDEERARWFANRFGQDAATVWVEDVEKADVYGYLTSRGEQEIILNPDHREWVEL